MNTFQPPISSPASHNLCKEKISKNPQQQKSDHTQKFLSLWPEGDRVDELMIKSHATSEIGYSLLNTEYAEKSTSQQTGKDLFLQRFDF